MNLPLLRRVRRRLSLRYLLLGVLLRRSSGLCPVRMPPTIAFAVTGAFAFAFAFAGAGAELLQLSVKHSISAVVSVAFAPQRRIVG